MITSSAIALPRSRRTASSVSCLSLHNWDTRCQLLPGEPWWYHVWNFHLKTSPKTSIKSLEERALGVLVFLKMKTILWCHIRAQVLLGYHLYLWRTAAAACRKSARSKRILPLHLPLSYHPPIPVQVYVWWNVRVHWYKGEQIRLLAWSLLQIAHCHGALPSRISPKVGITYKT